MKIEMELWHLITLVLTGISCVGAFGRLLMAQFEKRQDERFEAQDKARQEGQKALRDTLNLHLEDERRNTQALAALERDFLTWKADMPTQYVRREDYVRNQTIIEAKLDALALRLENVQLKGKMQ